MSSPVITTQPQSQTINIGSPVTFSVVASGTTPLAYQWKKNGVSIAGATSDSYTIGSVISSDAGSYSVTVSNGAGSATSNTAILTVGTPPIITTQPQSQTINLGYSVTFSVVASGTNPLNYQWTKNGISIAGATSDSYTIGSVISSDAGSYSVTVSNSAGSATSQNVTLAVLIPATSPIITIPPRSQIINEGSLVTFSVTVIGISPFSYQWYKKNSIIIDAISSSYSIPNANINDAGKYYVIVTNKYGSVISYPATLVVNHSNYLKLIIKKPQS